MKEAIRALAEGEGLSPEMARQAMGLLATGGATAAQAGAFLAALRVRGETAEEIAAFCRVLEEHAVTISPRVRGTLVDTCGTGGDGVSTFNISTAAAIVAAGAGVPVVKHGNRAVSSRCGSADVLEALGVNITLPPESVCRTVEEVGIGFLFAPLFHPAFRNVAGVRREMGCHTVFNILGPLLNPARAPARLIGVFSPRLLAPVAGALRLLGVRRALVVHGSGLDEISVSGETHVAELNGTGIEEYAIAPGDFGIPEYPLRDICGSGIEENAAIIRSILHGQRTGAARDIVAMNAGAALYAGGKVKEIGDGIELALDAIASGTAREKIDALARASRGNNDP
jgi:anthranilate phosphoribosyltransferase